MASSVGLRIVTVPKAISVPTSQAPPVSVVPSGTSSGPAGAPHPAAASRIAMAVAIAIRRYGLRHINNLCLGGKGVAAADVDPVASRIPPHIDLGRIAAGRSQANE